MFPDVAFVQMFHLSWGVTTNYGLWVQKRITLANLCLFVDIHYLMLKIMWKWFAFTILAVVLLS